MPFAGSVVPQGYLLCDGSAVSRTTYADLFSVLGTTFGSGDGSTTFNIPNLGGRVPLCTSSSHALGTTGGASTVTLQTANLPEHLHQVPAHGHANTIKATTPKFTHSITQPVFQYNKPNAKNTATNQTIAMITGTSTATASRSANAVVANHAAASCTKSGSITDHAAFTTNTKGEGGAHNNMQPYMAVNYIICTGV